jgi:hypothetical protein
MIFSAIEIAPSENRAWNMCVCMRHYRAGAPEMMSGAAPLVPLCFPYDRSHGG